MMNVFGVLKMCIKQIIGERIKASHSSREQAAKQREEEEDLCVAFFLAPSSYKKNYLNIDIDIFALIFSLPIL